MGTRSLAASGAALAVVLSTVAMTGCDLQRAVDCARLAVEVTDSVATFELATEGENPGVVVDAADEVTDDVAELRDRVEDTDVRAAADSVQEAVDSIADGVENGTPVDLSPLGDATAELTEVCTE
ncbi:hypothetical protein [Streptomyces sp. SBT349]|uniref:hypothetical protein n=1 Tax=Streptomyces sp. SBT349 TaxID=1580539 RepID=UPI0007C68F26|nr:hypothetical protein [Streptomyces sp. SBT349]